VGSKRVLLAIVLALVAFFVAARLRYPGKATVSLPAASCQAALGKHVYRPERLRVLEPCTAVEGRVASLEREKDGDLHIALDPKDKSVLNLFNVAHLHGQLAVELICEHTPSHGDAIAACTGFKPPEIILPSVGDRIRVTGAYVTDLDSGWNEIHPVTRIEILR
jgi:hypothetical protein